MSYILDKENVTALFFGRGEFCKRLYVVLKCSQLKSIVNQSNINSILLKDNIHSQPDAEIIFLFRQIQIYPSKIFNSVLDMPSQTCINVIHDVDFNFILICRAINFFRNSALFVDVIYRLSYQTRGEPSFSASRENSVRNE